MDQQRILVACDGDDRSFPAPKTAVLVTAAPARAASTPGPGRGSVSVSVSGEQPTAPRGLSPRAPADAIYPLADIDVELWFG